MPYEDVIVLIPSHSLEDFPTDLSEAEAASLLNSFVVAWHPALLAAARVIPRWHRADEPPDAAQKRLILLPTPCESLVPATWAERVTAEGCTVVRGLSERAALVDAALARFESPPTVDPEWVADFLALGFCYLQVELLTRKMRHYSNLDEVHLQREVVAAAEAALAGDGETVRTRLRTCFEALQEARERFYPVESYLIDICLIIPRVADDHFRGLLRTPTPVSVLGSAADLAEIAAQSAETRELIKAGCERGGVDLVCGDLCELPLPLLPLSSVVWQLGQAQQTLEQTYGRRAVVWGRRRYGPLPQLPQILKKSGFVGALHLVLDDGIYPDTEYSKMWWEGSDGTSIVALSRIPLAADAAVSFLRLPERLADSMDNDHVAAAVFARWPEVKCPFFEDLRRIGQYAPVLGRFVTLSEFFTNTDDPSRHVACKPNDYLAPFLFQSAARQEAEPIGRFAGRFERRARLEAGQFLSRLSTLLRGRSIQPGDADEIERAIESLPELATAEQIQPLATRLENFVAESATALADVVLRGAGDRPGWLVFNPLGFRRTVCVTIKHDGKAPQPTGENAWVQHEERRTRLTVDVPGAGFAWIPAAEKPGAVSPPSRAPVMAEPDLLRNEYFEVLLNEATGGIARIKGYGRSPPRLSQQVTYRFPRERTVTARSADHPQETRTQYAEMRRTGSEVVCAGPAVGEIVTTGEIVDQTNSQRLASFRQTTRVWRGRPFVEIDIDLVVDHLPDAEPWQNYYAARFAWQDETASLTRASMLGAVEVVDRERIESPHYLEIATPSERTTIVAPGLAFHRKTGPRMLDTLLIVPREGRRSFRFVIAVDCDYPLQAALDAASPAVVVPTSCGPPHAGTAGWFFHLNAKNVQLLELLPVVPEVPAADAPAESTSSAAAGCGCGLRLIETEGRSVRASVRCFRTPTRARRRDFAGKTVARLPIEGDAIVVDLSAHEIADVEIGFD